MRLYESTLDTGQRRLIVHLDEARVIARDDPRLGAEEFPWSAGQPDPDWTVEAVFEPYAEASAPLTGSAKTWKPKAGQEPPMRKMTRAEVEAQQEAEVVALAREALAAKLAAEDQAEAAGADPYAGGGKPVK